MSNVTITVIIIVTRKWYNVVSPNSSMDCTTENIVYLITCRKCGIQYVGETGQKLRSRINNHRNRLRKMTNLYLYNHFYSDGHTEDDINIMPIEKITSDGAASSSRRLEREDYWCRELDDKVRKVGNVRMN